MDRVKERLLDARQALNTLERVVGRPQATDIERDAAIQRFEYSFEMTWKTAQSYLFDREFLEAASPKAVIRASLQASLFGEETARKMLEMANDRNLTAHTYKEELARQIYSRLAFYAALMSAWLDEIETRIA